MATQKGAIGLLLQPMDDLELIRQKINIVDLVQEYLPLKKSGVNFKAPCPFHQEKTPSFVVSPERGIWHCFGCGKGGDIFKFLMEKDSLEFAEALEILAQKAGITLTRTQRKIDNKKERVLEINKKAAQFFHHLLTKHQLGEAALEYLHKRGLTDETISEFKLGYAPNSWDSLIKFLIKRGFKNTEIIESGLVVPSSRGGYDRFRGRIIFPLIDVNGSVRGFSGRILGVGEPKYLNGPQTITFDKSHFLFGLDKTKSEIRKSGKAILVEGEMDMLLSYQSGVRNVVASKGTALTGEQLELLKRYTEELLLCFDMDLAGDGASRRGIEMADQMGFNVRVVEIPTGKDPAELSLKSPKAWVKAVEEAEPIYDYYLKSAQKRYDLKDAVNKKKVALELFPIWNKITDPLVKEHYIQKLATLLSISDEMVRRSLDKQTQVSTTQALPTPTLTSQSNTISKTTSPKDRQQMLEEYLISLLLKIPENLIYVPNFPETLFTSKEIRSLYVMLVLYLDSKFFAASQFLIDEFVKTLPQELTNLADRLYLAEIDDKLSSSRNWETEVKKVVLELKRILVKSSLNKLSEHIKLAQSFGKIDQLEVLNKRFRDLSLKLRNL